LFRAILDRLLEPAGFFTVAGPGLFGIIGITVLGFTSGFPPAASVLQNFLWLHAKLVGSGKPLVASGFDFINLLVLDFILGLGS
jgi:hypothetical protein